MKIGNIEVYGIIYKITNKINGKCYIGQATRGFDKRYTSKGKDIEKVYNFYKKSKENKRYYNKHLFSAIEKYGIENFDVCKNYDIAFSKQELDIKEKYYIEQFDCIANGYNLDLGGSSGKHSEETKEKLREIHLGKKWTYERREKIKGENNPFYGGTPWNCKVIICVTTNEIFYSAKEASDKYKECRCGGNSKIIACCKKKRNYAGKLPNGTKLIWRYLTIIPL